MRRFGLFTTIATLVMALGFTGSTARTAPIHVPGAGGSAANLTAGGYWQFQVVALR